MSGASGQRTCRATSEEWDVVVVGAGPAGLFTALTLMLTSKLRVLLIDRGADVEHRFRDGGTASAGDHLVNGVGGAGLFSDGKLCLSLDVGGNLGSAKDANELRRLLTLVEEAFAVSRNIERESASDMPVAVEARRLGLDFSYYPVLHVGTEHCARHVRDIRNTVRSLGGHVVPDVTLVDVEVGRGHFRVRVSTRRGERIISAGRLVLAMGKSGADFQSRLCDAAGASSTTVPMYVGVRLEGANAELAPLFEGVRDPKFKMYFPDGTKVKTHCAGRDGFVLPVRYDSLPVAGGHAYRSIKSGRSSFAVLWDGVRTHDDPYTCARQLMRRCSDLANGRLMAQRLVDYLAFRSSSARAVEDAGPSTSEWSPGNLRQVLPPGFFQRFELFLSKLLGLAPDLCSPKTVLFGPAVEWWMRRITTDDSFETEIQGLYVAGDGAGWSQGIVHAAATGVVVGEAISGNALKPYAIERARSRTIRATLGDTRDDPTSVVRRFASS